MTTIGNDSIPGIISEVGTQDTIQTGGDSPSDGALVGPADLSGPEAVSVNVVERVTSSEDAREYFGSEATSLLTEQLLNVIREGGAPVYAVATSMTTVTDEDLGTSESGTLANVPLTEVTGDVTFTVDGSEQTTVKTLDDPSTLSLSDGETGYNPLTGAYAHDVIPADATADYEYPDYASALDALSEQEGEAIEYVAPVQEAPSVTELTHTMVKELEGFHEGCIALCGLMPDTEVAEEMPDVDYDSSRLQVCFPARDVDDVSYAGAWVGIKSRIGLDRSAMGVNSASHTRMRTRLSVQDEQHLVANNVVPVRSSTNGARIVADPTTVTDENDDEAGMRHGFARLVMDRVMEIVHEEETPFIGRLNNQSDRNALETLLDNRISALEASNAVEAYTLRVEERDAMSAEVVVVVDTADPLTNIYNSVMAGSIA